MNPIDSLELAEAALLAAQRQRRAYVLACRREGRSFAEIGRELGVSRQRVAQMIKQARADARRT